MRTGTIGPLVSTDALAANPGWRVFDCRHDLADPQAGERQYRQAHIPGARFAHLERDLSGPKTGANGRHPLPAFDAFVAWLGAEGLTPDDVVVCYDGAGGAMAARLWWMLRWAGHDAVAVLDGGLAKWLREGRPVSAEIPQYAPTVYPGRERREMAVDAAWVEANLGRVLLVDARAPARFRGEAEPIDPVAGHIPGAVNRFNNDNLTPEGTFKDAATLRREFDQLLAGRAPQEAVNYCGSGVSACHNLLAMEIAGLRGARLYPGSWSEWIADPRRRIARGG
ncbi:MAG: sulfurtransferase [Burkholderiales bacterium]|nr:sulfurtransferase [Burkholderiales bacterium]